MGPALIFWAEAAKEIGMGHAMECLAIASARRNAGASDVAFVINSYAPAIELIREQGFPFLEAGTRDFEAVIAFAKSRGAGTVVVNHRPAHLETLRALRAVGLRTVLIDQLGRRAVSCDVLINSTMIPEWLEYEFPDGKPDCRFGASYAMLREEFWALSGKARSLAGKRVLVSMGGVDRTGATLRLVEALRPLGPGVQKEFVLGKGFAHFAEFEKLLAREDASFTWAQNVSDLAARISRADLAISAGGNTMYELACLGTPALVLWEDPHEDSQGRAFATKGAAVNLGNGISTPAGEITAAVRDLLADPARLSAMSEAGRKLVDGRGLERVLGALGSAKGGAVFFARLGPELETATREARGSLVLGIRDEAPFFVDLPGHEGAWARCGVEALDLDRHWLNHYREIEADLRRELGVREGTLAGSSHVLLDTVWAVGDRYRKYVEAADRLLRELAPCSVHLSETTSFVGQLLHARAIHAGVKVERYQAQA